jgi:DNA-binding CsgD family transcriptional regulator
MTNLTPREIECVVLYASCMQEKEIAEELGCSNSTVSVHIQSARIKTNLPFTKLLIPYAYANKLITPEQAMKRYE